MHAVIGTSETREDILDPARAAALNAAIGAPAADRTLAPFAHHIYFWDAQPAPRLGRDGHPRTGGFIPDLGLPRRMWGGGRLAFHHPIALGQPATKHSEITGIRRTKGASGPVACLRIRHDFRQGGLLCRSEEQDLLYLNDPTPGAPRPPGHAADTDEDGSAALAVSTTLLFRYSALTFNGHRIHYDQAYATEVEGYPGLVVHGPLLADYLTRQAVDQLGPLSTFAFRAISPLFHTERADLCWKHTEGHLALWVRAGDGRLIMTATAEGS